MWFEGALDPFQKKKRQRMAYIINELYERGGKAKLDEFRGSISVNYGIRGKTQDEYFEELKSAGWINFLGDEILLVKDKDSVVEWLQKQGISLQKKKEE
ncbi:MAG: hypothetical protein QXR89_01715 [Candidatus Bathyarchaeia archaeon]